MNPLDDFSRLLFAFSRDASTNKSSFGRSSCSGLPRSAYDPAPRLFQLDPVPDPFRFHIVLLISFPSESMPPIVLVRLKSSFGGPPIGTPSGMPAPDAIGGVNGDPSTVGVTPPGKSPCIKLAPPPGRIASCPLLECDN